MITLLILFSLLKPVHAYQELELKPIRIEESQIPRLQLGRTYNYYKGSRIVPAKKAIYPILDQFEYLLFPQKDFKKEQAKARLERIEIAVHGNVQRGSIKNRLNLLENEISAWQIANYQTLKILETKKNQSHAYSYPEQPQRRTKVRRIPQRAYSRAPMTSRRKEVDYDYQNYRMASPLIRDIGRRTIRALFE